MGKKANKTITEKLQAWRIFIISGILFTLIFTPTILTAYSKDSYENHPQLKMLLSSGLADSEHAEVKYILWTEESRNTATVESIIESSGLNWQKFVLKDYSGRKAIKYSAKINVTKSNEEEALSLYQFLYRKLSGLEAIVYFEERIDSSLDPVIYIKECGVEITTKNQPPGIISVTGYDSALPCLISAGHKYMNFQLITKDTNMVDRGKTVLAAPVLFEEF